MKVSTRVLRSCLPPAAALSVLVAWAPAVNAGGHLDGAYGVGGYFLEQTPDSREDAPAAGISEYTAVAIAAGGEIYAAGFGSDDNCGVVAVSAAGEKVPGWGGDTATGFPCWEQDLRPSIAIHDDGRVVVAYPGGWQKLLLRRWTATGDPDLQFGAEGRVAVDIPFVLFGEPRIQAAPDGTVVVAFGGRQAENGCPGDLCAETPARLGVVRLSADGSVAASSFDLPPPAPAAAAYLHPIVGVAARADGSIITVVAGPDSCTSPSPCSDAISFIRLAADGTTSIRIARWGTYYSFPHRFLDGDTIFVYAYDNNDIRFLHRFDLDGERRGEPVPVAPEMGQVLAMSVGPSGALYAAGWDPGHGGQPGVVLLRNVVRAYRPDGQPEPSFTATGMDHGVSLHTRALRVAPAEGLTIASYSGGRLGALRLSLSSGGHPGRLGIAQRRVNGETGSLIGSSDGYSASTTINQRDTKLDFVVDRTGGSEGAVSVAYRIDGNAAAQGAFVPVDGRLDWAARETASKTIWLDIVAADPVEVGARVELRLTEPAGGVTLGSTTHVVHVVPASPGRLEFSYPNELQLLREGQQAVIAVSRRGGGNGSVGVTLRRVYVTTLGQPASPEDFTGPDEVVLSWADGETGAKVLSFGVPNDNKAEPREYFRWELSKPTGGATLGSATVEAAIAESSGSGGPGSGSGGSNPPPAAGHSRGGGGASSLAALIALGLFSVAAGAARRSRKIIRRSAT